MLNKPTDDSFNDPLYSDKIAGPYLGLKAESMPVLRCKGRLNIPYIKIGRMVRYRKSALDAYLDLNTFEVNQNV
jgi:hypothetical protein